MDKKIFLIFLLLFLLVGTVSALDFDNVKQYDQDTRTVTIINAFNLPLISDTIAKLQLISPRNIRVGMGYQRVATIRMYDWDRDFVGAMDDMNFYQINGYGQLNHFERTFDYKYKWYETEEYNLIENVCEWDDVNGTYQEVCELQETGEMGYYNKTVWITFSDIDELPDEDEIIIGIFTNVQKGDHVEWIPKFFGVTIEEWAGWQESWNTDLVLYHALNGTEKDVEDATGNYNATNNGAMRGVPSVVGNGFDFDGSQDYTTNDTVTEISGGQERTICFWINPDRRNDNDGIFYYGIGSTGQLFQIIFYSDKLSVAVVGGFDGFDTFKPLINEWSFDCVVFNGTTLGDTYGFQFNSTGNYTDKLVGTRVINTNATQITIGDFPTQSQFDGTLDELMVWSRSISQEEMFAIYNNGIGLSYQGVFDKPPVVTAYLPINTSNYSTSPQTIDFIAYGSDDYNFTEMEFYINGSLKQTNSSGLNNTNYTFTETLSDGDYNWSFTGNDNNSQQTSTDTFFLTIDSIDPYLYPATNLTDLVVYSMPTNSTWFFNATDPHIDKCYYNTSDDATLQIITCNSTQVTNWTTDGTKTIQFCANDTFGHETCNTTSIGVYSISIDQHDDPDPTVEGFDTIFNLTVNATDLPTTTAYLVLNSSIYTATGVAGQNGTFFETTVNIPMNWGNTTGNLIDWYWNYTIVGITTNQSSPTRTLTVYELAIDDCATYGEVILNLTLNDEETASILNASAGANVEIDLIISSKDNSTNYLTYNNTWENSSYSTVCIPNNVLNDTQWNINFTVGFDSTDHVWEFFYLEGGTLNATKIFDSQTDDIIDLMDLLTVDSTSFLFNYYDQDGLPVDDTIVHVYRKYIGDGVFREVERSRADQNGDTIVHLVEEDVIYYFVISQYGEILFTSSQYTALCQATPCTISIEASGGSVEFPTDYDLINGGAVSINESASTRQITLTYALNHTGTMNLTVYKYNSDGSFYAVDTGEDTGQTGAITLTVPQSAGNVSFFASIEKDDQFIKSEWIDFEAKATDRFGLALSIVIAFLVILTLGLVAVTEGSGTIVMVILGVFLSGALGLMTTKLSTGINIVIYLILAGGLILWKTTSRRRS